tara:strand:+ start:392 stop:1651 length:1260 start_codon:yes stop_codon:yes gene_type:complete
MPKVVSKKRSPIELGVSGLAGAFAGAAEGEQINIDRKLQERGLSMQEQGLNEQIRSNNMQQQMAVRQLESMQEQGMLSREQEERLTRFREDQAGARQRTGIQAETDLQDDSQNFQLQSQTREFSFRDDQLNKQLKQSDIENVRNVNSQNYATRKRAEGVATGHSLERRRLRSTEIQLDQSGDIIARYGDWAALSQPGQEDTRNEAIEALARAQVGQERWEGSQDVIPATDEEKSEALQDAARQLATHSQRRQSYQDSLVSLAASEAQARATGSEPRESTDTEEQILGTIFDFSAVVDSDTGLSPVNREAFRTAYGPLNLEFWDDIEDLMAEVSANAASQDPGLEDDGKTPRYISPAQMSMNLATFDERVAGIEADWRNNTGSHTKTMRDTLIDYARQVMRERITHAQMGPPESETDGAQ